MCRMILYDWPLGVACAKGGWSFGGDNIAMACIKKICTGNSLSILMTHVPNYNSKPTKWFGVSDVVRSIYQGTLKVPTSILEWRLRELLDEATVKVMAAQ
jgi:hypothetical protein